MKTATFDATLARTGSNVRGRTLASHHARLLAAFSRPFVREERAHQRAVKALFSKIQRQAASGLVEEVRREWHRLALQAELRSHPARREASRMALRRKLGRLLDRALPSYRSWQKLTKAHQQRQRQLAQLAFTDGASLDLDGGMQPVDPAAVQEFTPPYPLYDQRVTVDNAALNVADSSVVVPDNGHMMNRFTFDHDGASGFAFDAFFQLRRPLIAVPSVACGILYTPDRAGPLHVQAVLQNYVSRVYWSVLDQFGLSHGDLLIQQRLVITILRRSAPAITIPVTLISDGVSTNGIDAATGMNPVDNTSPYTLDGYTEETISAGETVQIFVGSDFRIKSSMDDMKSHVDAHVWWHLQRMTVTVG